MLLCAYFVVQGQNDEDEMESSINDGCVVVCNFGHG